MSRRYMAFNYRNRNTTFGLIEESEVKQLGVPVTNMTAQKLFNAISTTKIRVPKWFVNNTVKLWIQKEITDKVFIDSFRFLLEQGLIKIDTLPSGEPRVLTTEEFESIPEPEGIPLFTTVENRKIVIHFQDNTTMDFVLTEKEANLLVDLSLNDNRWFMSFRGDDVTTESSDGLANIQQAIAQKLATIPTDTIDSSMVSISMGAFTINESGNIQGSVIFIANTSFSEFWLGKDIVARFEFQNMQGKNIRITTGNGQSSKFKFNKLNFTQPERDETISINETLLIPISQIKIFVKVFPNEVDPRRFDTGKSQSIEVIIPNGDEPDFCPVGTHLFNGQCEPDDHTDPDDKVPTILTTLLGGVAILGSIALLATRRS